MKKIAVLLFGFAGLLMSCENPIRMETKVSEDGSLDKTIIVEKAEADNKVSQYFGVHEPNGWSILVENKMDSGDSTKRKVTMKKSFSSADEVNKELDVLSDSSFRIHTSFDKKFRWFYTYIRYSETFRPIDRFKLINPKNYFNLEDSLFIDRLPGEGTAISKADSLFLQQLNEKIFDHYAEDALFGEYYSILEEVVKRNTTDKKWLDTLARSKDFIFKKLDDMDGDPAFASKLADSLGIPLPKEKSARDFAELSQYLNSRINFMSFARDGKYTNVIDIPWTVVDSNADSVAGNKLYWRPLATKFAIQEFTMFAESRRLNLWAVIVSVLLIGLSAFVLLRSRARS